MKQYTALEEKAIEYYDCHHVDCKTDRNSPYFHARQILGMSHGQAMLHALGVPEIVCEKELVKQAEDAYESSLEVFE